MKVMVIVKASRGSEAGEMPSEELLTQMGKYNEELAKAGIMLAGEGLQPSSKGVRVHFRGQDRLVSDGPFAETKELIAGFWIWRVPSMQQAIDWVKRCPNPMNEESYIEIRPVFEAVDFGECLTPELREQEAVIGAVNIGLAAPTFVDAPERLISGRSQTYTRENRSEIPQQWRLFVPHIGTIPGQVGRTTYGVCWKSKSDGGFDYLTGVELNAAEELPKDFTCVRLPAGRYAVFTHDKHVSEIPVTVDAIWREWAPDCGLEIATTPWFERYTEAFDPQTGSGGIEIWVPLQT